MKKKETDAGEKLADSAIVVAVIIAVCGGVVAIAEDIKTDRQQTEEQSQPESK
jgi:hypothetical protein